MISTHAEILLANIDIRDVLGGIVTLLFLVLWVVSQVMEGKKQAGQPPARGPAQPAVPPPPQKAGVPPAAPKPPVAGGLRGEMEEFLRRAAAQASAKQPGAAQRRRQPQPQDRIEVLVDDEGKVVAERRRAESPRTLEDRTATSSPVPRVAPLRRAKPSSIANRETVAEHVSQHISSAARSIGDQATQLGRRIAEEDRQFDVQLKAKFDREVGTLAARRESEPTPTSADTRDTSSPAEQLAALLANPEGIRQAIVMNEILRRPSERW
jgi:hypothetical protein